MQQTGKNRFRLRAAALLAALCATLMVACKEPVDDVAEAAESVAMLEPLSCGENGFFRATLVGGMQAAVDWSGPAVRCESMLRPQGQGARLRFTGEIEEQQLAFILALPDLQAGEASKELPSNVTITVAGSGRFFSTPGLDSCWTDIIAQQALTDDHDRYAIEGVLFCIAPLVELNGDAAVTIADLKFRGIIEWNADVSSTAKLGST